MHVDSNRGGAKPRMLPVSHDVPITIERQCKFGIYEQGNGTLARRVELPEWLSKAYTPNGFDIAAAKRWMPREEIGESRGHIFLQPPATLFPCPAVGLDMEVYDRMVRDESIKRVVFYIYASGYRLVDVWAVTRKSFIRHCRYVQTKACFMPQMMVPLSVLVQMSQPEQRTVH